MAALTADKKHWYVEVFGIREPPTEGADATANQSASLVVEEIAQIGEANVHLTVFRDSWKYRFRHDCSVDEIFERIFGHGTGGIHVTLETEPAIHCFRGGPNEGRDDAEKATLQRLLDERIQGFKKQIEDLKQKHDAFEWQGCDDPEKRLEYLFCDVERDGFERLAGLASAVHGIPVVYPGQADSALVWSTASVHPMQALQNTHQRAVAEACRGLQGDALQDRSSAELGRYFFFKAMTPEKIGRAKDEQTVEEELQELETTLKTIKWLVADASPQLEVELVQRYLVQTANKLEGLWRVFRTPPRASGNPDQDARDAYAKLLLTVPAMAEVDHKLKRFTSGVRIFEQTDPPISRAEQLEACARLCTVLERAHYELSRSFGGLCCIQNFHTIEPFYLFRLLVRFQIRSEKAIDSGLRTKVSSTLTDLLHNSEHMAWLYTWLRNKIIELDERLKRACPGTGPDGQPKFVFYLKGGRAAKVLAGVPKEGENDWDTNIVINPLLPATEWYECFETIHNVVLRFLEQSKRQLLVELHQTDPYDDFLRSLDEARAKLEGDAETEGDAEPETAPGYMTARNGITLLGGAAGMLFGGGLTPMGAVGATLGAAAGNLLVRSYEQYYLDQTDSQVDQAESSLAKDIGLELTHTNKESCKAELIDIGIPRRDTIEAFSNWYHVCPDVMVCDEVPIPGHLYYIADYVLMVREAYIGTSRSVHKTPKRVVRLQEVLEMGELDTPVDREKGHIPQGTLGGSIAAVDGLVDPLRRVLTILLAQFSIAYDLDVDAGLAGCFDTKLTDDIGDMKGKANYPAELEQAIAAHKDAGKPYETKHEDLADAIGYAQWLAGEVGKHLRKERAEFVRKNRAELIHFVKAIYTGYMFHTAQEQTYEELEVQFAVTGAFAAQLHAENAKFERPEELEPPRWIDLTIYAQEGSDPKTVLELIMPAIEQYQNTAEQHDRTKFRMVPEDGVPTGDRVELFWPADHTFSAEFAYAPLMVRLQVVCVEGERPSLAFIRGLPVLSLRDLIWEYKRRAGYVEESFSQELLRTATDALVEILTRFENPNAGSAKLAPSQEAGEDQRPPQPPDQTPPAVQDETPVVTQEVEGLEFLTQHKGNWCWAATSLMMRRFYLHEDRELTQEQLVRTALGNDSNRQYTLVLSRLRPQGGTEGRVLSWDEITAEVDANRPFIFGSGGRDQAGTGGARQYPDHFWVVYGYRTQGPQQALLVWDPLSGTRVRKTLQQYQDMAQGGMTAAQFQRTERKALVPVRVEQDAFDTQRQDFALTVRPTCDPVVITGGTFRVRLWRPARNRIPEGLGETIFERDENAWPESMTWDGSCNRGDRATPRIQAADQEVVVELEVTLPEDETTIMGTENTQVRLPVR